MQLRNEPQVGLQLNLRKIAIVSSSIVGVAAIIFFFAGGFFKSGDSMAASVSVSNATTVQTNSNPFGNLQSGDTIFLYGKFNVNDDYTVHENNLITIIVDGSGAELKVFKDQVLKLGTGSAILLQNGGTIDATGNCTDETSIVIGGIEVANCPGDNGALSFSQVNSAGGVGAGALPVSWLDFDATIKNRNEVKLDWSTASEENNSHFDVEYSLDAENWMTAGTVYSASENGFSQSILEYSYTHYIYEVANTVYYRIKQTDHDGKFDYSEMVTTKFKDHAPVQIGTLGGNKININIGGETSRDAKVNVYDLTGNMLKSMDLSDNTIIQLEKEGVYIIEVVNGYDVQRIKHYVS